jgi:hypothetical protein
LKAGAGGDDVIDQDGSTGRANAPHALGQVLPALGQVETSLIFELP